jgi:hypothetical protein
MPDDDDAMLERELTKLRAAMKGGRPAGHRRKLIRYETAIRQRQPLNPITPTPSVEEVNNGE